MKPKPGYKTTEFWMTAATSLVGLVVASGALDETETDWDNRLAALAITALASLGYTAFRGLAKKSPQ